MVLLKAILGAVIGGAIGAAVWAGIAHWTGYEIGWLAWGVGLLVGGGTFALVRDDATPMTGVTAAGVAIIALCVGRYASIILTVDSVFSEHAAQIFEITDEHMLVKTADEVVGEWEAAGRTVKWPEGMTLDEADEESEYPKDVWKEATVRWGKHTPEEQQALKVEQEQIVRDAMAEFKAHAVDGGFLASFDLMDLLFCGLAVFTAYRVGAGVSSED